MKRQDDHADLVRRGYDEIAERYLEDRDRWASSVHLDRLLSHLPDRARILDVGCGAGEPVGTYLVERGHEVQGIDVSERQIELARTRVPEGQYEVADLLSLSPGKYDVDAVISFYAIFHTPRESHSQTLRTFATFLEPGGMLLITMAGSAWEGEEEFYGTTMWWSSHGPDTNVALVSDAGFDVLRDEIDETGGERHQVILARKI